MAGYISTYLAQKLQDYTLGVQSWTPPSTVYCRLWLTVPLASGTGGLEVSGGSYAAVSETNNSTTFPNSTSAVKTNGIIVTFPTPSADWGSVAGATWHDAGTGGNLLVVGTFATPRFIASGVVFSIAIGGFSWTFGAC